MTESGPSRRSWCGLGGMEAALVLVVASVARLTAVVVFDIRGLAAPVGEPWAIAGNLAAGNGFAFDWYGLYAEPVTTSFLPPLYPWILGGLLQLARGDGTTALYLAQAFNVCLGVGTCFAAAALADMSGPDATGTGASRRTWRGVSVRPAQLAALAWALYPPALGHTAKAHTPVLEGFLLLLLACLMLRASTAQHRSSVRGAGLAGLVLGLLLMVRPSFGLVWAAWSVLLVWRGRGCLQAWRPILLSGLVAAVVLAPWTVRNYQVHQRLVPVALNGGFNFYLGNNPQMTGDIPALGSFFQEFPPEGPEFWRDMSEVQRDREFYRQGLRYWRDHPADALRGALHRAGAYAFFRPYLLVAYPRWLAVIFVASYAAIFVPFLVALARRRDQVTGFAVAAVVTTGLVGLAYVISMRFRAAVEPFMVVVGSGFRK